jgi:hypothetical protein
MRAEMIRHGGVPSMERPKKKKKKKKKKKRTSGLPRAQIYT